jgi:hypothetical protein
MRLVASSSAVLLALTALTASCRRDAERQGDKAAPPASERPAADRLLPNELAEGKDRAMGIALPRDLHLERVFNDSASARGRVSAEALADYVRQRVDAPRAELEQTRTVFPRAHPRGAPADKIVRIEILREVDTTVLTLTDLTPPPVPSGLSEGERWRKAGVLPGKPFDPNAL